MSIYMSFSIPGPTEEARKFKKRIMDESLKHGMSMSEYVVEAIAEYMRTNCGKHA